MPQNVPGHVNPTELNNVNHYDFAKDSKGSILNQPISIPILENKLRSKPDVKPTNLGTISVYPVNIYANKVLSPPEEITISQSRVLRYYLFAETFVRPRRVQDNKVNQVQLIARSLKQPALYSVVNQEKYKNLLIPGHYNQVFTWEVFWKPENCKKVTVKNPEGVSDLPFFVPTTIIDLTKIEDYEPFSVPFVVKEGAEEKPVVFRTTLPIFDLYLES